MNDLISQITFNNLVDLIDQAKQRIYYCAPNIFDELADTLSKWINDKDIRVVISPTENNYRNGYGDIKAIDILKAAGIKIYEVQNNYISWIIVDNMGYFIFPVSKIFSSDSDGPNAVKMTDELMQNIIQRFIPTSSKDLFAETNSKVLSTGLNEDELEKVEKNLKLNPPLSPDIQRQIKTYTAKIQFVELKFIGANIHTLKVGLPPSSIPIKNEELKKMLEARYRLLPNIKNSSEFQKLEKVKDELKLLRDKHLMHISSRDKNIIHIITKQEFIKSLDIISLKIQELTKQLKLLISEEILNSKARIRNELIQFYTENPPDEYSYLSKNELPRHIEDFVVSKIIRYISFPSIDKVLKDFSLKYYFYDLTFEDFKDEKFLKELRKKNILTREDESEIVSMKDAFEARKE